MVYGLFKPCWLTHATWTCFKETALLFNVHLVCFVNFILCPTDKYIFKVNNEKIRLICWMCSKLKLNTTWHRSGVFIVDFDQSQYISIVFLFLTLKRFVSRVWKTSQCSETQKATYLFGTKSCKSSFIQQLIIAPNWNELWTNDHTMNILQCHRKFFHVEDGGLSKNAGHHGCLATNKNLAHSLKQSPKTKFGQNFKWFKISYLEFFFWKYYFEHTKFLYSSTRSSGHYQSFYLILRFSNRKSQSQQKLAKIFTRSIMQFRSKNLTQFTNLNSFDKIICSPNTVKSFSDFTNFPANIFLFGVRKEHFALHHFLTPKNCIFEALWKQMSVHFCISP